MNIPDDMIKEIELLAKRFEKLKAFIIISQGYRGSCARGGIALLKLMQNNLSSCRFSPKLVIR